MSSLVKGAIIRTSPEVSNRRLLKGKYAEGSDVFSFVPLRGWRHHHGRVRGRCKVRYRAHAVLAPVSDPTSTAKKVPLFEFYASVRSFLVIFVAEKRNMMHTDIIGELKRK